MKYTTPTERRVEADRRVARGRRFLDHHQKHWREKINSGLLNLANGTYCILGQAYGERDKRGRLKGSTTHSEEGFFIATERYSELMFNVARYGFERNEVDDGITYRDLNAAWRRVLRSG